MSVCDESCRDCIYSSFTAFIGLVCNYYLVHGVGNRRGCAAGKGCERRIVGEKAHSIERQIFLGERKPKKEPTPEQRERKKAYQAAWYQAHKEEQNAKRKARYDANRAQAVKVLREKKSWRDRKRLTQDRTRKICQGRQKAAINGYLEETGITIPKLAVILGVNEVTVRNWRNERNMADWAKLAQVGIRRPDGI